MFLYYLIHLWLQSSRIDDQRCSPPEAGQHALTVPDEDFFSLIQRVQAKRMDEQRVQLPSDDQDNPESPDPEWPRSQDCEEFWGINVKIRFLRTALKGELTWLILTQVPCAIAGALIYCFSVNKKNKRPSKSVHSSLKKQRKKKPVQIGLKYLQFNALTSLKIVFVGVRRTDWHCVLEFTRTGSIQNNSKFQICSKRFVKYKTLQCMSDALRAILLLQFSVCGFHHSERKKKNYYLNS